MIYSNYRENAEEISSSARLLKSVKEPKESEVVKHYRNVVKEWKEMSLREEDVLRASQLKNIEKLLDCLYNYKLYEEAMSAL